MTPFNITIDITEATQCHHAVSQLLRVFPKLRLTITVQDETIPTPSRPPQTGHADYLHCSCGVCAAYRRDLPDYFISREACREYIDTCIGHLTASDRINSVGADEARKAADPSGKPSDEEHAAHYSETPTRAENERLAAEAAAAERDWRDNNSDPSS